ncbi:MAG: glycosyltransferase [Oscillochloris sp.]|nr:glycosyltransferase [Oscillochloris sp.]
MRIAFVTNICPHYRVQTFETLARYHDVDYYFFSAGDEWYWQRQHGVQSGNFKHVYLPGVRIGNTRITPTLLPQLLHGNYDLYVKCINGRFALPVTYLAARLRRKPFVLWTGIWQRLDTPAHRLFFPLTRYFYRHADAVAVYGEHVKRYLIGEGVSAEKIFIATHALDNQSYRRSLPADERRQLLADLNIEPHQRIVLSLGRLEPSKGLDVLLKAFALANRPESVLLIVGTGSLRAELERQAAELGLSERVRFAGYVANEQAWRYYALAWMLAVPSVTMPAFKEPWGLVVNEAFNQGVPVIASDAVGAAVGGLVRDGETGLVVPERDAAALALALGTLLDQPELRDRMGRNAAQLIAGWDNEAMVAGFRAALDYAVCTNAAISKGLSR